MPALVTDTAFVLSVGEEILAGDILDTNAHGIVSRLTERGVRCVGTACARDTLESVEVAVQRALSEAPLVIVTGGLGPTKDDLTREGVAAALGLELVEHPELLAAAQGRNKLLSEGARRQAWLPVGCEVLHNANGTAPGFAAARDGRTVACFPGPPNELWPMLEEFLQRRGVGELSEALRLKLCGVSESVVGERLADLMDTSAGDCRVGVTASRGILTVTVRGSDRALMQHVHADARERLGAHVFGEGDTTLAEAVVQRLTARGETLSLAESCTGGLLAGAITSAPGSSAVFERSFVTYANSAKQELLGVSEALLVEHGAVSESVAAAMAAGALAESGADHALSVTGIAGPGGGTPEKPVGTVWFGYAGKAGARTRSVGWGGSREVIRTRSVQLALDMLRRALDGV